jgi:hypothetical protein
MTDVGNALCSSGDTTGTKTLNHGGYSLVPYIKRTPSSAKLAVIRKGQSRSYRTKHAKASRPLTDSNFKPLGLLATPEADATTLTVYFPWPSNTPELADITFTEFINTPWAEWERDLERCHDC